MPAHQTPCQQKCDQIQAHTCFVEQPTIMLTKRVSTAICSQLMEIVNISSIKTSIYFQTYVLFVKLFLI